MLYVSCMHNTYLWTCILYITHMCPSLTTHEHTQKQGAFFSESIRNPLLCSPLYLHPFGRRTHLSPPWSLQCDAPVCHPTPLCAVTSHSFSLHRDTQLLPLLCKPSLTYPVWHLLLLPLLWYHSLYALLPIPLLSMVTLSLVSLVPLQDTDTISNSTFTMYPRLLHHKRRITRPFPVSSSQCPASSFLSLSLFFLDVE